MENKKNMIEIFTKKQRVLKQSLPPLDKIIRGSLMKRYIKCGKINCRCHKKEGHGPYYYLTINNTNGITKCVQIPQKFVKEVKKWMQNYKKTKQVLKRISDLNLRCLEYKKKAKE